MSDIGKTLEMSLSNAGFLVDKLNQDCAPLQFVRELTQNAIEAIKRRWERGGKKEGSIVWDVDEILLEEDDVVKLCITDDGDGMSAEEMKRYINQLSCSGGVQGRHGNYGIGAKISTFPLNPHGVQYISFREGKGNMVWVWRDPVRNTYGLKPFDNGHGGVDHSCEIDPDAGPRLFNRNTITKHGTRVVLLGQDEDENTAISWVKGSKITYWWIPKYLNSRYFRFPEGISVRARTFKASGQPDNLSLVHGAKANLDKVALASGTLQLSDCKVYWWIRNESVRSTTESASAEVAGSVGALYQDEIYDLSTGRSAQIAMQNMGITAAFNRFAVYFEPEVTDQLGTDAARRQLLLANERLPWEQWYHEFMTNMPTEIRVFLEEIHAQQERKNFDGDYRKRLQQILKLISSTTFVRRKHKKGAEEEEGDTILPEDGDAPVTPGEGTNNSSKKKRKPTNGNAYNRRKPPKDEGTDEADEPKTVLPTIVWKYESTGTREPDEMSDRASRYIPGSHTVYANGDFRGYTEMVDMIAAEYEDKPGRNQIVREVVEEWCGQQLAEAVAAVIALHNSSPEWNEVDRERALSEEGLTSLAMARWSCYYPVKRALGSKLGKVRELAQASV